MDVDVVVIGSGAGGLTAALCLAQAGQKVVVLEQHDVPGGWCHSFTLEGYRFSPGVHYIGELEPGHRMARIYEGLGVSRDVSFCELNPDGFDHVLVGGERFDIPKGRTRLAERLKERFPHERRGIDAYLETCQRLADELDGLFELKGMHDVIRLPVRARTVARWGLSSASSMLGHFVSDPLLLAILSAQSGDHGLPPSMAPAPVHASIAAHYFNGGYYPRGGGFALPRAFVRALKRAGGEIRLETRVDRILMERGRAIGVRLADGQEIRARQVISNADPGVTFGKMLEPSQLPAGLRWRLGRARYSVSALSLFLAVEMPLRARGFDSGNYWYYAHRDVDAIYRMPLTEPTRLDDIPGLFVTVTTLKDPSKMHKGHHTLEAFTFVSYDLFASWARSRYGDRPDGYLELKKDLQARMIRAVGRVIPGIEQHVVFSDLGTPLSNEHYCFATRGNLYGLEKSRWQVGPFAFPVKSGIDGLTLCGASTVSHGVAGATISGLAAAKGLLHCSTAELLRQKGPSIEIYPSDDITRWPDGLRRRIEPERGASSSGLPLEPERGA